MTDTIESVKIDARTLRLYSIHNRTKFIDIKFDNLKEIWEKYEDLKEQEANEIILARNNE